MFSQLDCFFKFTFQIVVVVLVEVRLLAVLEKINHNVKDRDEIITSASAFEFKVIQAWKNNTSSIDLISAFLYVVPRLFVNETTAEAEVNQIDIVLIKNVVICLNYVIKTFVPLVIEQ